MKDCGRSPCPTASSWPWPSSPLPSCCPRLAAGLRPPKPTSPCERPLVGLEDDFNRLFAGLPARRDIGFRVWDDVMAFQGTISPATTHTLLVESPVPMYWKARTYDTYTGKGWISEHTEFHPPGYKPEFAVSSKPQSRVTATYAVTPLYSSPILFAGPRVDAVDRDVEIETPSMPVYRADLTSPDPFAGYPDALADAGVALAERRGRCRLPARPNSPLCCPPTSVFPKSNGMGTGTRPL